MPITQKEKKYLKNKHKGGKNNSKGAIYESYYATYQIVSFMNQYITQLSNVHLTTQLHDAFVDDLFIEEPNAHKTYHQLKDVKDLTWENVNLYEALIDKAKYEKIECAIYKKSNKYKLLFYDRNVSWFKMSSGQDAKFTFEAKLYWALIGGQEFKNCYSDSLGKDSEQIDMSRCISKGDSAIIYIDEGDLYYHPEWQRQFMKSILDIVKLRKEECYLQLIVTSNSPYILSDFLTRMLYILFLMGKSAIWLKHLVKIYIHC